MDLSTLLKTEENGPVRKGQLVAEIEDRRKEARTLEFYLEALRLLRVSWSDSDPGKYTAHWYAFERGRKVWPRELVDVRAVDAHDDKRITRHPKLDPTPLADFHRLDREDCPACKASGLVLGCYQQTEDGPSGDTWTKALYVACGACLACYPLGPIRSSSGRF